MTIPNYTTYILLIQTNKYAGNFERDVCAHVTGHAGECGVGQQYIDESIAEIFEDYVQSFPDEDGCWRPCSMWEGKVIEHRDTKTNYSQIAIFFEKRPTNEMFQVIEARLATFLENCNPYGYYDGLEFEKISLVYRKIETVETELPI